jgi:hypothetical protein
VHKTLDLKKKNTKVVKKVVFLPDCCKIILSKCIKTKKIVQKKNKLAHGMKNNVL